MAVDVGLDGLDAPATVDGVAWPLYIEVRARSETARGRQLLDPEYGFGFVETFGSERADARQLRRWAQQQLEDIPGFRGQLQVVRRGGVLQATVSAGTEE